MATSFNHPRPVEHSQTSQLLRATLLMAALFSTLFILLLSPIVRSHVFANPLPKNIGGKDENLSDHLGAVASESDICSRIGIDLLRANGTAADAMVGTTFCVGVVGSHHSGIGGGGFLLLRDSHGNYEDIDCRETAAASYFQDMYVGNRNGSIFGGLAAGVPGEIRCLEYIHKKYGKLPWKQVMQPAIRVARDGWILGHDLSHAMDQVTSYAGNFLVDDPSFAIDFAPNGTRLGVGDLITRQRYAKTLEAIANEGPDAFYTGHIAETMVKALQSSNGTMSMKDLKDYKVAIRTPVHITYRNYKLHSNSAPSSGPVALAILKILEGYTDLLHPETVNLSTHRLSEAMRFAYGERTELGDPDFVSGMAAFQQSMISATKSNAIHNKINDAHTLNVSAYNPSGLEVSESHGTSHIVTADHTGMAASFTTTVNLYFGNGIMVPETGVIVNNEMDDFSIPGTDNAFGYPASPANYIRAGKRSLSSITPVIVEYPDGKLYYVIGSAGGSRIITATVQNIINVLDRNMTVLEAIQEPRLHDQLLPNLAQFEISFDNSTVAFMEERGHNVSWVQPGQSSVQGIRLLGNGTFEAAGESRQVNSGGFAV